jgi:hypothetical protein
VQNASGRHESLFPKFVLSSWVKHPGREAVSSPPPSTEGNNARSLSLETFKTFDDSKTLGQIDGYIKEEESWK